LVERSEADDHHSISSDFGANHEATGAMMKPYGRAVEKPDAGGAGTRPGSSLPFPIFDLLSEGVLA
jgi:hypothetical protein